MRANLERREARLAEREHRLDDELRRIEDKSAALDQRRHELDQRQAELDALGHDLDQAEAAQHKELERIGGLTAEQAKQELVAVIENQARREAALTIRDIEREAQAEGDKRARKIVTLAIIPAMCADSTRCLSTFWP
ncbi:MAG TPA: Rnase Y domain-containing protein [Streptosporangiaceae bacterium]|nr:Rnase Y domain-containing protein [Streptosporangiaceae bacterium]